MADETKAGTQIPKADTQAPKKERNRSPAFPSISLREAIARARTLYEKEGVSWAPVNVAARHWGFTAKSSSGVRTVAALLHFGLADEDGAGDNRRIRLSERGKTIVLAPPESHSEELDRAIRAAALTPKLYGELWKKHEPKLPSDDTLEYELIKDGTFNRDSVRGFIKDFKSSLEFAKVGNGDRLGENGGGRTDATEDRVADKDVPPRTPDPKPKMPSIDIQQTAPFDLFVPLMGGQTATLRIPRQMTAENFQLLTALITANLTAMRPALVVTASDAGQKAEEAE